jgi:hypothetical protein
MCAEAQKLAEQSCQMEFLPEVLAKSKLLSALKKVAPAGISEVGRRDVSEL